MQSNFKKYEVELDALIKTGGQLHLSMQHECHKKEVEDLYKKTYPKDFAKLIKALPSFKSEYQTWYSESNSVIKQLLPDRLNDFIRLYEKPKTRKDITYGNYVIEDYLQGIQVTRGGEVIVPKSAAIPQFEQQLSILESAKKRFSSSLFDLKQLVQADLLDSELDAARLLEKHKFFRAAGAIAGVVIEKHLSQVAENHNLSMLKKNPTISDLNDLLKKNDVIEIAQWRSIQYLGDIRNLCDHNKLKEPTKSDIDDLISGAEKLTKTLY